MSGVERKGSMFLRSSDKMHYGRAVLNSNWHQAREAEPKDHDIFKGPVRDMHQSTYHRLGSFDDGVGQTSTYQNLCREVFAKENEVNRRLLSDRQTAVSEMERETGRHRSSNSILPKCDSDKFALGTTYSDAYSREFVPMAVDLSSAQTIWTPALKKCHSQFTDTVDYRRYGRNTWQDESGIYANSHLRASLPVFSRTYTTMLPNAPGQEIGKRRSFVYY